MKGSGFLASGVAVLALSCASRDASSSGSPVENSGARGGANAGAGGTVSASGGTSGSGGVVLGAGGTSSGGASTGGAPNDSDAGPGHPPPSQDGGPPPVEKLRYAAPGDVVQFDPDAVYVAGYVSDVNHYEGPYGIAPITDVSDTVLAIGLFANVYLRRSDGRLLQSYEATDSNGSGVPSPLYEFRRDEGNLSNPSQGETAVADIVSTCAAVPRGPFGIENRTGRYRLGYDGTPYLSCYISLGVNQGAVENWYTADGKQLPLGGLYPSTFGASGRVLAGTDGGSIFVVDLATGARHGGHTATEVLGADSGTRAVLSQRALPDGFTLAVGPFNYIHTEDLFYVDLDLNGEVAHTGSYAPLPMGVTIPDGNWTGKYPAIDGKGALYQFAVFGTDDGVIVRRPRAGQGESEILYHQVESSVSHPHEVDPEYLVTAQ